MSFHVLANLATSETSDKLALQCWIATKAESHKVHKRHKCKDDNSQHDTLAAQQDNLYSMCSLSRDYTQVAHIHYIPSLSGEKHNNYM